MASDTRPSTTVARTATTGHEWDGIRELNTPLPRWWLYTSTPASSGRSAIGSSFPAWPLVGGYTAGVLGWIRAAPGRRRTRRIAPAARARRCGSNRPRRAKSKKTPELLAFARARGRAAFAINCAPCHGAGGQGRRLSQSQRRPLAVGRYARSDRNDHHARRALGPTRTRIQSQMPAFGTTACSSPTRSVVVGRITCAPCPACAGRRAPISPPARNSSPTIARPATATTARATSNWARRT